jgi:hypothetical protein
MWLVLSARGVLGDEWWWCGCCKAARLGRLVITGAGMDPMSRSGTLKGFENLGGTGSWKGEFELEEGI